MRRFRGQKVTKPLKRLAGRASRILVQVAPQSRCYYVPCSLISDDSSCSCATEVGVAENDKFVTLSRQDRTPKIVVYPSLFPASHTGNGLSLVEEGNRPTVLPFVILDNKPVVWIVGVDWKSRSVPRRAGVTKQEREAMLAECLLT
jgi:hypothetical protein